MTTSADRGAAFTLALTAVSVLVVTFAELPLMWDGSNFLFTALNDQAPVLFLHRYVESLFTAPVVLASKVTEDLAILRSVFSFSYAAVPFVALLGSWLLVRRMRPDLFVWPVVGIGLALLPGRAVAFAESLIVAQLCWPLILAALLPVGPKPLLACLGIGLVVAVSHPIAVVFLLVVGVIGFVERRRSGGGSLPWLAACLGLAVLNVALMGSRPAPYEVEHLQPFGILIQLIASGAGPQSAGLVLVALAAWLVHRDPRDRSTADTTRPDLRAMVAIGVAGGTFVMWALIPEIWKWVIDFRAWAAPATLPLFLLAWLDARRTDPVARAPLVQRRMRISGVAAAVMLAVLIAQSAVWGTLLAGVRAAVADGKDCVPTGSIHGFPDTALGNWNIIPLSVILQGRDVHAFIAPPLLCRTARWPAEIPMLVSPGSGDAEAVPPLTPRWFRFQP